MITIRAQLPNDVPDIVKLYNLIVDAGGYALAAAEFNRHITEQDWQDWTDFYEYTVLLVFEDNGSFHGFCSLLEADEGEIKYAHLGVFNPAGPDEDIMWLIVEWIKANTTYLTMVMDRTDLTNVGLFDSLATALGAKLADNIWRRDLASAVRP